MIACGGVSLKRASETNAATTHPFGSALAPPAVSVVIPTYNERANMRPLVAAVAEALGGIDWEIIIVDDDSPDGTWAEVHDLARDEPRARCIRRVGRRGLASAVLEGAMAANADLIAVMDADFQHDERALRTMFEAMHDAPIDLVVGSRYAAGGGIGDWDQTRRKMSDLGTRMSRLLVGSRTSDPLCGFFMIRRAVLTESIHEFSQSGYKILLDILASAPATIRIAEVPYHFRDRRAGDSKISLMIVADFAFLLVDKLTHGWVSPRFVLFALVGGLGLGVHLGILTALHAGGQSFLAAQSLATLGAMIFNFGLNNEFTYRDRRLSGAAALGGLVLFMVICSIGSIANIGVAELAIRQTASWSLSGVLGALIGAVFNFGVANKLVWSQRKPRAVAVPAVADLAATDDDAGSLALSPIGRNR